MENKSNNIAVKRKLPAKSATAVLLVLILLISGAVMAFAAKSPDVELINGFYVIVNDHDNYTVVGLDGTQSSTALLIPEALNGKTVDEIAGGAFSGSRMKNFIVPTTIEYIGKNAFDGEGIFYIYMVGRKNLRNIEVEENWSGVGEVIFQDVRPQINTLPDVKEVEEFSSSANRPSSNITIEGELPFDESLLDNPDFTTDFDTQNPSLIYDNELTKNNPMTRIDIVAPPTKTEYVEKQVFNSNGMLVKAVYQDGFTQLVSGYVYSKELLTVNKKFITISYSEAGITKTAEQAISVSVKKPVKLTVKNPPEKVQYVEGQSFTLDGAVVVAEYNNGETRIVTPYYDNVPLKLSQVDVELTYFENRANVKVNQPVDVVKKVPDKLTIKAPAIKTSYIEGNLFDKTGLVLEVTDNDGEKKEVTDFIYPTEKLVAGETEAVLAYKRDDIIIRTFQPITVTKRLPTKLEIVTPPNNTLYIEDMPFNPDGLTVKATYDNGDIEFVAPKYQKENLVLGQKEIKLLYDENGVSVETMQPVTVVARTPVSVNITHEPIKINYIEEESFNNEGMEVSVTFDNGKTHIVTGYTFLDAELVYGQTFVKVSYSENNMTLDVSQPISVRKRIPTDLFVTAPPNKLRYIEDTVFNADGMIISARYDNGKTHIVTGYTFTAEPIPFGTAHITVTYIENGGTVSVNQPITVVEKQLTGLEIVQMPNKLNYVEDEYFDVTGMIVNAVYDNGFKQSVTATYDNVPLAVGQSNVEVSYTNSKGETASAAVSVTVAPKAPSGITVTKLPDKTAYYQGEIFREAGMIVTASYDNGMTRQVYDYTYPKVQLTQGQISVELSYTAGGVTVKANVPITVGAQRALYKKYSSKKEIVDSGEVETGDTKIQARNTYLNYIEGPAVTGNGTYRYIQTEYFYAANGTLVDDKFIGRKTKASSAANGWYLSETDHDYIQSFAGGGINGTAADVLYDDERHYITWHGAEYEDRYSIPGATYIDKYRNYRIDKIHTYRITDVADEYIEDVILTDGSVPENGLHSDGCWYVRQYAIEESYMPNIISYRAAKSNILPKTPKLTPVIGQRYPYTLRIFDGFDTETRKPTYHTEIRWTIPYTGEKTETAKTSVYEKFTSDGSIKIGEVTAPDNTLPADGKHTDGYYYRKKA